MTVLYTDLTKLKHAKMIAKECNCFIVEKGNIDNKEFLLYREGKPKNAFIAKRSTVDGILKFVNKVTRKE